MKSTVVPAIFCCFYMVFPPGAKAASTPAENAGYDASQAMTISQAAIGTTLPDLVLTDAGGKQVQLASYTGRPVLISMIFTSCYHVCPAITQHLAVATQAAHGFTWQIAFAVLGRLLSQHFFVHMYHDLVMIRTGGGLCLSGQAGCCIT